MTKSKFSKTVYSSYYTMVGRNFCEKCEMGLIDKRQAEEIIENLKIVRKEYDASIRRIMVFGMPLTLVVYSSVFFGFNDVIIYGISLKGIDKYRDLLMVLSVILSLFTLLFSYQNNCINSVIDEYSKGKFKNKSARMFWVASFGGVPISWVVVGGVGERWVFPKTITNIIHNSGLIIYIVMYFLACLFLFSVHLYVVYCVINQSSFSGFLYYFVSVFILLGFVASVIISFGFRLPLPYEDSSELNDLDRIKSERGFLAYLKKLDWLSRNAE